MTWAFSPLGDSDQYPYPHIEVDHATDTLSGSIVYVTRTFPGDIIRVASHWTWTPQQAVDVGAWVDQLHRMPLEEIP